MIIGEDTGEFGDRHSHCKTHPRKFQHCDHIRFWNTFMQ